MVPTNQDRKKLSFEQAEGVVALPTQLQPGELSRELRVNLWNLLYLRIQGELYVSGRARFFEDDSDWRIIFLSDHVARRHKFIDDFGENADAHLQVMKGEFVNGSYVQVLGFLTFVLRHPRCPADLSEDVSSALVRSMAAYRLWDGDTFVPFGSEAEMMAVSQGAAIPINSHFQGAKAHLKEAATALSTGHFASSIRDSIHAVEAVARQLEPTASTLAPALSKLEKNGRIHPAMKQGFSALYGYTSDEQGIRHALVDFGEANADEADAMYMFGTCAAFVSYLIRKAA